MFIKIKETIKKILSLNQQRGSILMLSLVFGAVASLVIIFGLASYAVFENKASIRGQNREMAFHMAEAGVNYYRWHLAHNQTDFQDGTELSGPYLHEYKDKDGNIIGYYSLSIKAPLTGSTVVVVSSTGWVAWQPETKRTVQVTLGISSLTNYTFLSNANMSFSNTSVTYGPIHSNGGIRFDGVSDSWVQSAKNKYMYYNASSGNYEEHKGVWGGGSPKSFWRYPVPEIDFYAVTADLSEVRNDADDGGIHLTSSGVEGYHLVFNQDNFNLYQVDTRDCYNGYGRWRNGWSGRYWDGDIYCYDIKTETFLQNYSIPANGAIFVEDDVWVEGVVNGRVSLGVGMFPVQEPYHKIYLNNNLTYNAKASDDVIGLLAQGDIVAPHDTPNNFEINAAMLSQFGKIYRPYYDSDIKNSLSIFGSQISYLGSGWKYSHSLNGSLLSGYDHTTYSYDSNLRYYPPPNFPIGATYDLIKWEEVK